MKCQNFTKIVAKFSPFIRETVEEIYPSSQALKIPSWHGWIIPHDMNGEELSKSLSFLLGEYKFIGAYREELTIYSFKEDPRVPHVMLHARSKTGVHVFLLATISASHQYSVFNQIVQMCNLQLREIESEFITIIDETYPLENRKEFPLQQLSEILFKLSRPYLNNTSSTELTVHAIYDALFINDIGHSLQKISVFYTEEAALDGLVGAIFFRGGINRDCHVFLPFFEKNVRTSDTIQCDCLSTILTGITPSDLGTPILPNYSSWLLSGVTGTKNDLKKLVKLFASSSFYRSSISISVMHFNETGQTSIKEDNSALSFFNFAVPNVKHQMGFPVNAASANARFSNVPPAKFFNDE